MDTLIFETWDLEDVISETPPNYMKEFKTDSAKITILLSKAFDDDSKGFLKFNIVSRELPPNSNDFKILIKMTNRANSIPTFFTITSQSSDAMIFIPATLEVLKSNYLVDGRLSLFFRFNFISQPQKLTFAGLENLLYNCFFNSVIQTLFHIPAFRYQIFQIDSDSTINSDFVHGIQHLFIQLSQNSIVSPTLLSDLLHWEPLYMKSQQDAHDFLRKLLRDVFQVCPPIQELFTILTDNKGRRESFYDLMVPHLSGQLSQDIEQSYFDDNTSLVSLPPILQIQLNIFNFTGEFKTFSFQEIFTFPTTDEQFKLFSVIEYHGSARGNFSSGHFISHVLLDNRWVLFNDRFVTQEGETFQSKPTFTPYILTYVRLKDWDSIFRPFDISPYTKFSNPNPTTSLTIIDEHDLKERIKHGLSFRPFSRCSLSQTTSPFGNRITNLQFYHEVAKMKQKERMESIRIWSTDDLQIPLNVISHTGSTVYQSRPLYFVEYKSPNTSLEMKEYPYFIAEFDFYQSPKVQFIDKKYFDPKTTIVRSMYNNGDLAFVDDSNGIPRQLDLSKTIQENKIRPCSVIYFQEIPPKIRYIRKSNQKIIVLSDFYEECLPSTFDKYFEFLYFPVNVTLVKFGKQTRNINVYRVPVFTSAELMHKFVADSMCKDQIILFDSNGQFKGFTIDMANQRIELTYAKIDRMPEEGEFAARIKLDQKPMVKIVPNGTTISDMKSLLGPNVTCEDVDDRKLMPKDRHVCFFTK